MYITWITLLGIFCVILLAKFWLKIRLRYGRCSSKARLDGRTALVTGCNTGIGKETVMDFYKRGARVIMACRNLDKAAETKSSIEEACEGLHGVGTLILIRLDLCSLESVRECVRQILKSEPQLNILVNNAGVMTCPEGRTEDGFEIQFGSNHLGHFLLTLLLLPRIRSSKEARIVTVASLGHMMLTRTTLDDLNWEKRPYNSIQAYALSKTANILFSSELARKLQEYNIHNVRTYSLHPGVIKTDLGRHLGGLLPGLTWMWYNWSQLVVRTPALGAQTTIYCAVDEQCAGETGLYYSDCEVTEPWTYAKSSAYSKMIWKKSTEMVRLGDYNPFTEIDRRVKL